MKKITGKKSLLLIFLMLLLILFLLWNAGFFDRSAEPEINLKINKTIFFNETIIRTETEVFSFERFLFDPSKYHYEDVEVKGFLRYKISKENLGVKEYVYTVVDDDDNEIILTKVVGELKDLFEFYNGTEDVFLVIGEFQTRIAPTIKVYKIKAAERDEKEIIEVVEREIGVVEG